jgi:hypothetical protein|tara:strand:- start:2150 stop:2428 length:279 start_codon:yes stop_codon:yes gene_type:complete
MKKETIFIDAVENKMIGVFKGAGNCVARVKDAKALKYVFETHKIDVFMDRMFYGSTMDFADEVGFAHQDDAKRIVNACIDMIECETVAKELV